MATVVAVDVGTVRVGCAVADTAVKIPFPVAVWPRAQGQAERALLAELAARGATTLVVGLPLDEHGARTATCEGIEGFVRRIVKRTPISVVYVDEAFSSVDASDRIQHRSHKQSTYVDAFAACLILERYFDESLAAPQAKT